jgi:hypothetical protein
VAHLDCIRRAIGMHKHSPELPQRLHNEVVKTNLRESIIIMRKLANLRLRDVDGMAVVQWTHGKSQRTLVVAFAEKLLHDKLA